MVDLDRSRIVRIAAISLLVITAPLPYSTPASTQDDPILIGQRIYRDGILPNNRALLGIVQGDLVLRGAQAACVNCHRRSGYGTQEANQTVPPITARALFQPRPNSGPWTGAERSAYTDVGLRQALVQGIHASGRDLRAPMPRYSLTENETQALLCYLKTLSASPSPGISAQDIHFATILTDNVPANQRKALLEVFDRYFIDKNNDLRLLQDRGFSHGKSLRHWRLHVWDLHGPANSWGRQLEDHYRQQPVFALLGGIGHGAWQEIHHGCEKLALPCLLPNTNEPYDNPGDFYSIYFTRGVIQAADVLASHLREAVRALPRHITQVYREGSPGQAATQRLQQDLAGQPTLYLQQQAISATTTLTPTWWQAIFLQSSDTYVLWLGDDDLTTLPETMPSNISQLYLASELLDAPPPLSPAWRAHTQLVQLHTLAQTWQQQRKPLDAWLQKHQLEPQHTPLQANTTWLLAWVNQALEHLPSEDISREYLIERLEHIQINSNAWPAFYPQFSLGTRQHIASQGGYVVPLDDTAPEPNTAHWIIPRYPVQRTTNEDILSTSIK
ncbi:MAG: hypothetical protein HY080_11100 [Gammaproteobacteria bacterium]|nr:hypothetical protein [Gammaproteobacteria bacterium]